MSFQKSNKQIDFLKATNFYDPQPYDDLDEGNYGMYWLGRPCYPEPCCQIADCCYRHAAALARDAAAKKLPTADALLKAAQAKEAAHWERIRLGKF